MTPMRTAHEVGRAVWNAPHMDLQLSHAAAMLAEPEQYSLIEEHEPTVHTIPSLTALSVQPTGEVKYATALFGYFTPRSTASIARAGEDFIAKLREHRQQHDMSSLLDQTEVRHALHERFQEGFQGTLGGQVLVEQPAGVDRRTFVSNELIDVFSDLLNGKTVAMAQPEVNAQADEEAAKMMAMAHLIRVAADATPRNQTPVQTPRAFRVVI